MQTKLNVKRIWNISTIQSDVDASNPKSYSCAQTWKQKLLFANFFQLVEIWLIWKLFVVYWFDGKIKRIKFEWSLRKSENRIFSHLVFLICLL